MISNRTYRNSDWHTHPLLRCRMDTALSWISSQRNSKSLKWDDVMHISLPKVTVTSHLRACWLWRYRSLCGTKWFSSYNWFRQRKASWSLWNTGTGKSLVLWTWDLFAALGSVTWTSQTLYKQTNSLPYNTTEEVVEILEPDILVVC